MEAIKTIDVCLPITIIPRNGEKNKWEEINPVPKVGEIIVSKCEDGKYLYLVGDGVHHYRDLPYRSLEYALYNGYMYSSNCIVRVRLPEHLPQKEEATIT